MIRSRRDERTWRKTKIGRRSDNFRSWTKGFLRKNKRTSEEEEDKFLKKEKKKKKKKKREEHNEAGSVPKQTPHSRSK